MRSKICRWLVDVLSRTLEPGECAVVLGDFAESDATGKQALRDVWSLVVRRQAELWRDWRHWVTLLALTIPLGVLLSLASRGLANTHSIYLWLYAYNWDRDFPTDGAYWRQLGRLTASGLVAWLALACWSWTTGFVIGALSRRTVWVSGAFYVLTVVLVAPPAPTPFSGHLPVPYTARNLDLRAAVFEHGFSRVMLPIVVQAVLVLLPSIWGMRRGLRLAKNPPLLRAILWTAAIATLAGLMAQDWIEVWAWFRPSDHLSLSAFGAGFRREIWRLQLVVYWPVVYMAAGAIGRRWRGMGRHANS